MTHLRNNRRSSNRLLVNLLSLAFALGACTASQAMSSLVSITIEPQWPETSQPGSVVLYTVTVTRAGQGNLEVDLSSAGLPEGVSAAFSLNPVRFTGRAPITLSTTLTLTCTNLTSTDTCPFTITGSGKHGGMTVTNQTGLTGPLTAAAQPATGPMLALDRLSAPSMRLRGQGAHGQTYQVQSTPSLSAPVWTTTGSSTADGNGRFTFIDANPNPAPMRFYRTVLPADASVGAP